MANGRSGRRRHQVFKRCGVVRGRGEFFRLHGKLSSTELSSLVRQFYNNAGDTVYLFGAHHMQFVGEGLLAVFVNSTDTDTVNSGLRASKAAVGLIDAAQRVQGFLAGQFPGRTLPRFEVSVGLNSGPVTLAKLEDPARQIADPAGRRHRQRHLAAAKTGPPGRLEDCRQRQFAARSSRLSPDRAPQTLFAGWRSSAVDAAELLGLSL